jgi:hypothetical protein
VADGQEHRCELFAPEKGGTFGIFQHSTTFQGLVILLYSRCDVVLKTSPEVFPETTHVPSPGCRLRGFEKDKRFPKSVLSEPWTAQSTWTEYSTWRVSEVFEMDLRI